MNGAKIKMRFPLTAAGIGLALLGGCAQTVRNETPYVKAADVIRQLAERERAETQAQAKLFRSDSAWLGLKVVEPKRDRQLPPSFSDPVLFRSVFPDQVQIDINSVIERMSRIGIQVRLDADVNDGAAQSKPVASSGPGAQAMQSAQASAAAALQGYKFSYIKAETVTDLLDLIAAKAGLVWDVRGNTVFFYRYETRTFQLAVVPGTQLVKLSADSSGGSSGAGASGGGGKSSGQATQSGDATFDPVKSIVAVLESIKTSNGKVKANESTATITVTDAPEVVERMAKYIKTENARLSRQLHVRVQVYALNQNASTEFGMDWSSLYSALGGDRSASFTTPSGSAAGSSRLSYGILKDSYRVDLGLTALSQSGNAALIDEASDLIMNYRPKSLHATRLLNYVAETKVTQVVNAGTSTEVKQASVDSGFRVNITPAIQENDSVLMKLSIDLSSLDNLETKVIDRSIIQLPDVSRRLSLGEVALRNGQAMMIVGLNRDRVNDAMSGTLPRTILAGGNTRATTQAEKLVMIVTPTIIEGTN